MSEVREAASYGVVRKPRPETLRKLERISEMRAAGMSWAKIADALGCAPQNAYEMAKRWGVA